MAILKHERIRRIILHPTRKRNWGIALLVIGAVSLSTLFTPATSATFGGSSLVGGIVIYLGLGLYLFLSYRADQKFIQNVSDEDIQRVREALRPSPVYVNSENSTAISPTYAGNANPGDKYGPVVLSEVLWLSTVTIYKNGYIKLNYRGMAVPEKLIAISKNTDMMVLQRGKRQRGGAMLVVVTDKGTYDIKAQTQRGSDYQTPKILATLEKIVLVGQSVIQR